MAKATKTIAAKKPTKNHKPSAITDDLEEELGTTAPSAESLKKLSAKVMTAGALMEQIENIEQILRAHKQELNELTTKDIPDTMREAGTSLFKTTDGKLKVELKPFLNGSLPKEEVARSKAMKWLEDNGAAALIKTTFDLALGRGQLADAKKVRASLNKLGMTYNEKEDVHAQSLYAFARERMKEAKELPLDLLGLYSGTVAKIEIAGK